MHKISFFPFPIAMVGTNKQKIQQTPEWVAKKVHSHWEPASSWRFCMCTTFNYLRLLTTWDAKEEKTIEWLAFHLIYHKSERRPWASERGMLRMAKNAKKVPDISIVKFLSFPLPDSAVHPSLSWFCSLLDERHHPFDTFDPFLLAPLCSDPYSFIIVLEWCSSCAS